MVHLDQSEQTAAHRATGEDIKVAVLSAYTSACRGSVQTRRRAFELAVRVYSKRHPDLPEASVRQRVARIVCFAEWCRTG
jgi:hypothetical protein